MAISIIIWLAVSVYLNNKKFSETAKRVALTNQVLYHSEEILAQSIDLESGQRGFTITGNPIFLQHYRKASEEVHDHVLNLKKLTIKNPEQQNRILKLQELVNNKLWFTDEVITARTLSFEAALEKNATLKGKQLMDSIRLVIDEFQAHEKKSLASRGLVTENDRQRFNATFIALLVVTMVILVIVFILINLNFKARMLAEQSLKKAAAEIKDIYDHAPCGYHSLNNDGVFVEINQTWLTWIQYTRDEVVGKLKFSDLLTPASAAIFNGDFTRFRSTGVVNDAELDVVRKDGSVFPALMNATALYDESGKFVKSRSTAIDYTELRQAREKIQYLNQEAEAFSYSVSHDLRSPLRFIEGYARILREDYADQVDEEGKRLLKVIMKNTRRMGQLIDDLLNFSKVGRKDIIKAPVDMDNLVRSVFAEQMENQKQRKIEYKIHFLQSCMADRNLIRQVWTNLISNALKYTSRNDATYIEVSSAQVNDEIIYSIKDNGSGFDKEYAGKLFNVFQRLHSQQDFEGTGVGLAIVKNIVSRHGGRTWAEGKVNEGAEFYFSLPHAANQK